MSQRLKPPRALSLTAALLALALAACGQAKAPAGAAAGAPPPPEVGVITVQPQTVAISSELSGRTVANVIAEIRPQIGGIVLKRLFHEGGEVKAGDLLYLIDPAVYQANYEVAKAGAEKAQANLLTLRPKAERYQALLSAKAVSQQGFDDVNASLRQAEAELASSKAAVELARINLAYTRVVSPISGRIGRSTVTQGALVAANQAAALATVQQLDPINVDVTQSSSEMMQMKRALDAGSLKSAGAGEARVKLLLDDGSLYAQEGRMAFSEATVDAGTGTVTLRVVFPNPRRDLLPGMYVRAVVEQGVKENAIVVPQQGVAHDPKGNAVAMLVNAEGKAEARQIKTERAIGNQWLVNQGLAAGDRLIVEGLQKARPGAAVTAVAAGTPSAAAKAPAAPATKP